MRWPTWSCRSVGTASPDGSPDQPSLVSARLRLRIGLADALLVLDQGEPDVAVSVGTESDAGRQRDVRPRVTRHEQNSTEPISLYGSGICAQTNIVPFGGSISHPIRLSPPHSASRRDW